MQNKADTIENKPLKKEYFLSIFAILLFCNIILTELAASPPIFAASKEVKAVNKQFILYSPGFRQGQLMPKRYTADGSNASPELAWTSIPAGTKSFALICEDPDAPGGTWIHWLIYDIPANKFSLPQALPAEATLKDQSKQAVNSFRHIGYGGPSPPPGPAHRYFFKLYALNEMFGYESTMNLHKFSDFVQKHKIAEAETMALYGR